MIIDMVYLPINNPPPQPPPLLPLPQAPRINFNWRSNFDKACVYFELSCLMLSKLEIFLVLKQPFSLILRALVAF